MRLARRDLVRCVRSPDHLACEFESSARLIRNRVRQADRDKGRQSDGTKAGEREELRRLGREVRRLRVEREILAKPGPGSLGRRAGRRLEVHERALGRVQHRISELFVHVQDQTFEARQARRLRHRDTCPSQKENPALGMVEE